MKPNGFDSLIVIWLWSFGIGCWSCSLYYDRVSRNYDGATIDGEDMIIIKMDYFIQVIIQDCIQTCHELYTICIRIKRGFCQSQNNLSVTHVTGWRVNVDPSIDSID